MATCATSTACRTSIAGPSRSKLKLLSLPSDTQEATLASVETNPVRSSGIQILKVILYDAYDVRLEVRNDILHKEQEYLRSIVMTHL